MCLPQQAARLPTWHFWASKMEYSERERVEVTSFLDMEAAQYLFYLVQSVTACDCVGVVHWGLCLDYMPQLLSLM